MNPDQQPYQPQQPAQYPNPPEPSSGQPASGQQFDPNQFDFIMNPQKPKRPSLIGSGKQRIFILAGGAVALLILLIVIASMLFSGGNEGTDRLVRLAQQQNEIVRVADIGVSKAGTTEAKDLAISTKLTLTTDQRQLVAYLEQAGGKKLSGRDLALATSSKTDEDLTTAERNGRFDELFMTIMTQSLEDYQRSLQAAYNTTQNERTKQLLLGDINNVVLLLKQ